MKGSIYGFRDLKVGEYIIVCLFKNDSGMQRQFLEWVTRDQFPFARHPKDYAVHSLCVFDSETGVISDAVVRDVTPYSEVESAVAAKKAEASNGKA